MPWKESDIVTADDLLPEMMEYTSLMLGYLADAKISANFRDIAGLSHIDLWFMPEPHPPMKERLLANGATIIEQEAPSVTHPRIIKAFGNAFIKIMKTAGYTEADDRRHLQIQKNEFSTGGSFSLMSISDFAFSCQTTPEELKEALTVKDTEFLKSVCHAALEEEIARMEEFKRKMTESGIDLTREFDPLSFAQELQDKGLPSPKAFHAVLKEGDSDDIPDNNEPVSPKKQPKPH